jgi:hypothetical protein
MTISLRDATRASPAGIDRHGLVFEAAGQWYRAFRGSDAELFDRLLQAPWLDELFNAGLIRFRRSAVAVEGHDLVVEIDLVPVVSFPQEWPTVMLRDAGVMVARLGSVLAEHGLSLHDAHPWNVLFEGPRPVWIDLGSLRAGVGVSKAWTWEFRQHFVLPLALHRAHLGHLADAVQRTHLGGWKAALDRRWLRLWPLGYWRVARLRSQPDRFYHALSAYVARMPDRGASTVWSTYRQGRGAEVGQRDRYTGKQRAVDALLGQLSPGSLIDIGANAGWFSRLATHHGQRVIAIDTDDPTLGALYLRARQDEDEIFALRLDFMWPLGSHGLALAHRSAPDRLRSDTAMALALLHHLVGRQGISFGAFAKTMDLFARRSVIVEFIPREDEHISSWPIAREPWYDPDQFIEAMRPYFQHIKTIGSSPPPRTLMLFERETSSDSQG